MPQTNFFAPTKTGTSLTIRLTPNAAHNRVDGVEIRDDNLCVLRVRVTAIPDKGKANKALIALLAKTFKCPKNTITISAGHTARIKTIHIVGDPKTLASVLNGVRAQF